MEARIAVQIEQAWPAILLKSARSTLVRITLLSLAFSFSSEAQGNGTNSTTSMFLARTAEQLNSPSIATFHYLQFLQIRANWIYPDIGYADYGKNNYREFFFGGGRILYNGKFVTWIEELYFVQSAGPAAHSARYLWPWTMLQVRFTPKLASETVYFFYAPLNDSARIQHVIDRSKAEYRLSRSWKIGAGYSGYKFADMDWQNKPFLTATLLTRAGAFEVWLQKVPAGAELQLRYQFVKK